MTEPSSPSAENERVQTLLAAARAARPNVGKEPPLEVTSLLARKRAEKEREPALRPAWDNDLYIGLKEGPAIVADGRTRPQGIVPSSLLESNVSASTYSSLVTDLLEIL